MKTVSDHLRNIVLIADASSSAAPFWGQTAKAVADLIATMPAGSVRGVYALGTQLYWEAEAWRPDLPLPPEAASTGSFVAPIMNLIRARRENPQAIIIVGAGEVYDLADWVEIQNSARWGLEHEGGESLQSAGGKALEVTPDNLAPLNDLLRPAPTAPLRRQPDPRQGIVEQTWRLDHAGYPLVYTPPLKGFVHLFPVAKPQFEHFMADARSPERGDSWYAELLKLNPRLSPAAPSFAEREQLFVTGLLPEDAQAFARWQGAGYRLLTVEEWRAAFRWMQTQGVSVMPFEQEEHEHELAPTARRLWDGLLAELNPKTLLDLSLMQGGVIELATGPGGALLGMGQPREQFHPNFHDPLRDKPLEPTAFRSKLYGARLFFQN